MSEKFPLYEGWGHLKIQFWGIGSKDIQDSIVRGRNMIFNFFYQGSRTKTNMQ